MTRLAARKMIRIEKVVVLLVGLAVVLALSASVASTTLAGTEADGKDPAGSPSREVALEPLGGSEQMSSGAGSVGSSADSRSPSLESREQPGREQVSGSEGSVGSDADSRSPLIY
jgi:hypothetical protein